MPIATSQSMNRPSRPIVRPPAIQKTEEARSQMMIRVKLRKLAGLCRRSDHSMKPVRPSCMKT